MEDVWVGAFALIGVVCLAVLTICVLRVLNRRAASRASIRRPGDPSYQRPQELQALRDRMQRR